MTLDNKFLDDVFLGCSFKAFVELAVACKGMPDVEATRLRAYELYEESIAQSNRSVSLSADANGLRPP